MKLPENKDLYSIDVEKIKEELRHSDDWGKIEEIYEYCFELLNENPDWNCERMYSLDEIINKLEELD